MTAKAARSTRVPSWSGSVAKELQIGKLFPSLKHYCKDVRIQSLPPRPTPPKKQPDPKRPQEPREVGAEKTGSQHAGNVAFGLASVLGTVGHIKKLAAISKVGPVARFVPGLNLAAAGIEGVNAMRKYRAGDHVVAMTAAGNSVGCLSSFLSESSLVALRMQRDATSSALATAGGLLGLVAGGIEINQGLKLKKSTGSSRTLTMGVLDITSGLVSLTGAVLVGRGMHRNLGMTMLIGSGVIDIAGIGVDYLWPTGKK